MSAVESNHVPRPVSITERIHRNLFSDFEEPALTVAASDVHQ